MVNWLAILGLDSNISPTGIRPVCFRRFLAAAAAHSASYSRNSQVIPVAGSPGAGNLSVYSIARSRPLDDSLPTLPTHLLSVHLKCSVLVECPC